MHFYRRIVLAGATSLAAAASAQALEVTRSRDLAAAPAAVWALAGDLCAIGRWHPQVTRCTLSSEDDDDTARVQVRGLVLRGGTLVEVETTRDEQGMSYSTSFVQGPLPVGAYNATLSVLPNGSGSTVVWTGTFDAAGASEAEALAAVADLYESGLAGLAREADRPAGAEASASRLPQVPQNVR